MGLTDKQTKWLDGIATARADGEKAKEAVEARRLAQSRIEFEIMDKRDSLRDFLEGVVMTKEAETAFEQFKAMIGRADQIRLLEPGGDPMKELDTYHDAEFLKFIPEPQRSEVQKEFMDLVDFCHDLEAMTFGDPPQKVYETEEDLRADLWDPLVREGIIPENFVPGRFSEVEATFGAAAELYEKRLQEYTEELGSWDNFADKFETAATCAKLGFDIAAAITEAEGAVSVLRAGGDLDTSEAFKKTKEQVEMLNLIGASIAAVGTGTKAAIKDKDVVSSLDSFTKVVTNTVTAAAGDGVGKAVGSVMTAVVHAYPISKRIKTWRETGEWKWSEMISDLGDAVSNGIATGDGASDRTFYANIGKAVKAGFDVIAAGASTIEASSEERMLDALAAKFGAAATKIAGAIVDIMKEKETEKALEAAGAKKSDGLTEHEKDEIKEDIAKKYELSTSELEEGEALDEIAEILESRREEFAKGVEGFDEAEKERLEARTQDVQNAAIKEYMERPDPTFEAMLTTGFSEAAFEDAPDEDDTSPEAVQARAEQEERRVKSIENMIAIQKKNEATYKLSEMIVKTATGITTKALSETIPGLGIVAVAQEMMYAMYEAAKQGQEFLIWQANVEMGSNAHTVQVEAILSRHGLQKKQSIEAGIAAALKAAKLVGEVLKLAGHAAPAGYIVSAASTSAAALLEVSSKVATEVQVRTAWKDYQAAIKQPKDRKLARQALRSNPTLAKYAMAYGAVVEKHPIAKEVMRRCGLNDTTLSDPSASVGKVVEYLETLYKDDPVVLRATAIPEAWHAGPVELKSTSWTVSIFNAQNAKAPDKKRADPLLAPIDATGVAGSLQAYEAVADAAGTGTDNEAKRDSLKAAIAAAERLELAFSRFKPMAVGDTPTSHKEVENYAEALSGQCTLQKREWEAELRAVEDAIAEAAAQEETDLPETT